MANFATALCLCESKSRRARVARGAARSRGVCGVVTPGCISRGEAAHRRVRNLCVFCAGHRSVSDRGPRRISAAC